MASLKEYRDIRLEKLEKLEKLGINPYPAKANRTHTNSEVIENYSELEGKDVTIVGRVTSIRSHNIISFIDIKDASGKIQLYLKEENLKNSDYKNSEIKYNDLNLIDTSDFIEATGIVTKTKSGEISVEVKTLRLLAKALRPIPEELKDKDVRQRRRYLDTNVNKEVFERYIRRAKFWEAHREFMKSKGFLEINIPVLENTPGGADANPFITHMDALDTDFYLRISQELYLKRLIGGGYEKVYEIGPRFRNEGLSDEHLPEHIAMEFYWAYGDFWEGIKLVIDMTRYVAEEVYGTQKFNMREHKIDFSKEWEIFDYVELIKNKFGTDVLNTTVEEVKETLKKANVEFDEDITVVRGIDTLWKELRKEIIGPAIVVNEPKALSPLAKVNPDNPELTLRFHPIVAGSELGNGFAELNNPIDQLQRFKKQQQMRDGGDSEAQFMDIDFVEMLEYGMPPTFGYGLSERVFWFMENVSAREGVPFTQFKHELDQTTKEIYNLK